MEVGTVPRMVATAEVHTVVALVELAVTGCQTLELV